LTVCALHAAPWFVRMQGHRPPLRTPSAKNLEDAANRAATSSRVNLTQASNALGVAPRVPSAQRLTPLGTARSGSSPAPSDASTATSAGKLQGAADPVDEVSPEMSREELIRLAKSLRKETAALKDQLTAISGSGEPGSGGGMHTAAPPTGVPAGESPRKSGVSFAPAHRNSVLVVEFQRPSMITHTPEQIR
jgi:hypothetical protein